MDVVTTASLKSVYGCPKVTSGTTGDAVPKKDTGLGELSLVRKSVTGDVVAKFATLLSKTENLPLFTQPILSNKMVDSQQSAIFLFAFLGRSEVIGKKVKRK